MIDDFHFLRPLWLLVLIPLAFIGLALWRQKTRSLAWDNICDKHLLDHLTQKHDTHDHLSLYFLLISAVFFIISLAGPSWVRLPVPSFQPVEPRVIVLNLSENMLYKDLSPDRLSRAKFKLHDLFRIHHDGQWGMVVYTGEPFIVSPLTEDAETIAALLPSLTPNIMPVAGQHLETALEQAAKLIFQAGFNYGKILVFSPMPPSSQAVRTAKKLAEEHIMTSIVPVNDNITFDAAFQHLADAGEGQVLPLSADSAAFKKWLTTNDALKTYKLSQHDHIPLWKDEGRWFLIPALCFFLPVFRRGWLQGMAA